MVGEGEMEERNETHSHPRPSDSAKTLARLIVDLQTSTSPQTSTLHHRPNNSNPLEARHHDAYPATSGPHARREHNRRKLIAPRHITTDVCTGVFAKQSEAGGGSCARGSL